MYRDLSPESQPIEAEDLAMKIFIQIIFMLIPWKFRRILLNRLLKYDLAETAYIGYSLIIADKLVMRDGARIGSLTLVKSLKELRMGERARLGNLNWVTGFSGGENSKFFSKDINRRSALIIGDHAAITHRHLIDCTDTVTVGRFTTLAGWGSQILTHGIILSENRQSAAPVSIGEYCFIGTRSILLKGSALPSRSVLAPGSVLSTVEVDEGYLYSGVRAVQVKRLDDGMAYFQRATGFVH